MYGNILQIFNKYYNQDKIFNGRIYLVHRKKKAEMADPMISTYE